MEHDFRARVAGTLTPFLTSLVPVVTGSKMANAPRVLIGQPAPGGGTFTSFATFYDLNNKGVLIFTAEVDTTGAGTFQLLNGQLSRVTAPGIATVGAVRINDAGDMAFGDASVPGRTEAIYLLKAGAGNPTKIAEWGSSTPIAGTTYFDPRGPLALSQNGDVVFSSEVHQTWTDTIMCCYLFLYSAASNSVVKVVGTGDTSPIGGAFDVGPANASQITSDGDVVFFSIVDAASRIGGAFRFSRTQGILKVIAQGDPAPGAIGGTLSSPSFSIRSVAGRKLVFAASISGGSASSGIFLKDDVTMTGGTNLHAVALSGKSTGTEVGGTFVGPFVAGFGFPLARSDGAVGFQSLLAGATSVTGPTDRGIFLWTPRGFAKTVVSRDRLPSGGVIGGVSSPIINDVGQILYFVLSIQ